MVDRKMEHKMKMKTKMKILILGMILSLSACEEKASFTFECEDCVVEGPAGTAGADGTDGQNGADGLNGSDGQDGSNSIIAIIDPCGDAPNIHDEVLLKLDDGRLLASFSSNVNGDYTRFSILQPGVNYMTTDGSGCFFSVDTGNNLFNEHY